MGINSEFCDPAQRCGALETIYAATLRLACKNLCIYLISLSYVSDIQKHK